MGQGVLWTPELFSLKVTEIQIEWPLVESGIDYKMVDFVVRHGFQAQLDQGDQRVPSLGLCLAVTLGCAFLGVYFVPWHTLPKWQKDVQLQLWTETPAYQNQPNEYLCPIRARQLPRGNAHVHHTHPWTNHFDVAPKTSGLDRLGARDG